MTRLEEKIDRRAMAAAKKLRDPARIAPRWLWLLGMFIKRAWWWVQRKLRLGWQGHVERIRRGIPDDPRMSPESPWLRPDHYAYATPEEVMAHKERQEHFNSLRCKDGDMTIGRLAGKLHDEG